MKINKKYQIVVFTFLLALSMSCLTSFIMIWIHVGFGPLFIKIWSKSWLLSFLITFPATYVLPNVVKKFMTKFMVSDEK